MILFEEYKKAIEIHKKNKDLFIVKSYIRDDDINSTKIQRNFTKVKDDDLDRNSVIPLGVNKVDQEQRQLENKKKYNNDYDFNRNICRHRYTYVCKLNNFILRDRKLYYDILLSVRIIKVIDNPMNVPEIYENNVLKFIISPQYMNLCETDVCDSFSMFYKKIKNNKIYCKNGKLNPFTETKGFYYMEMKLYNEK